MKSLYLSPSPKLEPRSWATKQPMISRAKKKKKVLSKLRCLWQFFADHQRCSLQWPPTGDADGRCLESSFIFVAHFCRSSRLRSQQLFLTENFLQCPHRLQHWSQMAPNRLQPILALQGQVNGLCNYVSHVHGHGQCLRCNGIENGQQYLTPAGAVSRPLATSARRSFGSCCAMLVGGAGWELAVCAHCLRWCVQVKVTGETTSRCQPHFIGGRVQKWTCDAHFVCLFQALGCPKQPHLT